MECLTSTLEGHIEGARCLRCCENWRRGWEVGVVAADAVTLESRFDSRFAFLEDIHKLCMWGCTGTSCLFLSRFFPSTNNERYYRILVTVIDASSLIMRRPV